MGKGLISMIVNVFLLFMIGGWVIFLLSFKSSNLPNEEKPNIESLNVLQRKLYHILKLNGYKVQLFQPCGRYTIEMAIPHYRIAIECPSKVISFPTHQESAYPKKDLYLANRGWIILRFSTSMLQHHSHQVLKRIEDKILETQVP